MLYKRIDTAEQLRNEFIAYNRDYYSIEAYEAILSYLEDLEPNGTELDVIAICCDFTEATFEDVVNDYNLRMDYDGWEIDVLAILQKNTWATETVSDKVLYINY